MKILLIEFLIIGGLILVGVTTTPWASLGIFMILCGNNLDQDPR